MCGAKTTDESQVLRFTLPHFGDSAHIYISSKLNEAATNESWGIRNINIEAIQEHYQTVVFSDFINKDLPKYNENWTIQNPSGGTAPYVSTFNNQ